MYISVGRPGREWETYTAQNVVVVGEMGLAVCAAVDLGAVEVGIVSETHSCFYFCGGSRL